MHIHIHIYIHTYIYIYTYIHIYRHTDRQTDSQTDRQTYIHPYVWLLSWNDQLGRSATTSAGRSESTRFGWHVAHSSGYMCVETAAQVQVVDLRIGWGADVLQRDCGGDSAFSLAPSGKCVAACMDQSWKQLTILDVLLRYLEGLTALTCCAALLRTCKTMSKQSGFFQSDNMCDAEGGSQHVVDADLLSELALSTPAVAASSLLFPENTVDWNRRISEFEGLCRHYVILLTNLPEFWFRIPSPFLNISEADWSSGLLLSSKPLSQRKASGGLHHDGKEKVALKTHGATCPEGLHNFLKTAFSIDFCRERAREHPGMIDH